VDGDGLVGVGSTQGDSLARDQNDAGGGDAPLPAVVDHLEQARADVLAFTAFQK
jgi:hypothetical protein